MRPSCLGFSTGLCWRVRSGIGNSCRVWQPNGNRRCLISSGSSARALRLELRAVPRPALRCAQRAACALPIRGGGVAQGGRGAPCASRTSPRSHNRGLPFAFIAPGALATPVSLTNVIIVAKDSPDTDGRRSQRQNDRDQRAQGSPADLRSVVDRYARRRFEDDRKFIEVAVSQMAAAVVSHRVDAAKGDEPFVSEAKSNVRAIGNAEDGIVLDRPVSAGDLVWRKP